MINLINAIRKFQRSVEKSWKSYRLSHEGNRIKEFIAHIIRSALKLVFTHKEKIWINRIEYLRTKMNASARQITIIDFGAGDPGSKRTQEEFRGGIEITDTLGHISRASKSASWCCLLFKLIRTVHPTSCIEMGTSVGISAAYQAAALRLNGHGTLITLEGAASLADIAKNNFQQLGLDVEVVVGRFQDKLPAVLSTQQPVDYVFIDGHHYEQATLTYFEQILPFLAEIALLVFDDIAWSRGMKRAWNTIAHDKRVSISVELGPVGLCVIDSSNTGHRYFRVISILNTFAKLGRIKQSKRQTRV